MILSEWTERAIKLDYESGMTIEQVAVKNSVGYRCCRNHLLKMGVKFRPCGRGNRLPPDIREKIVGLYESGVKRSAIPRRLKVSWSFVCQVLIAAGYRARVGRSGKFLIVSWGDRASA